MASWEVVVSIPAGDYLMGCVDGRDEERPVHRVRIASFRIARCQVNNAEYDAFVRSTGRARSRFRDLATFAAPTQPVVGVSWFDAVAYCDWISEQSETRVRLPTEAEWEWAARGGLIGARYPWGDWPPESLPGYHSLWREGPEPPGALPPNGYGLLDMCANVHEWCSDWYDPAYYSTSPEANPVGPAAGTRRASRGGSWRHHIKLSRCSARSSIPPEFEYADYGFRVVGDA